MEEQPNRIFLDALGHFIKHIISGGTVFHERIPLSVSLQADALPQLIHIVDVIHPLAVDHL